MKEFLEPRLEVLQFCADEILVASGVPDNNGGGVGGIETPDKPFGA